MEKKNGSSVATEEIRNGIDSSDGSCDFNDFEDTDDSLEPNHMLCRPEELVAALNNLHTVSGEYVISFQLLQSPLIVIAKNDRIEDRITFPIYNRIIQHTSNSLQMKTGEFQILNSYWEEYLVNFVIPKIKFKMVLDFEIKARLKSFWILQSPSALKTLTCNSDLDENTFATLIIQLPSKIEGGQHSIIQTEYRYGYFDFSGESDGKSEFSSFCFVYHRDFRHAMKPITQGVGAYLVYHLVIDGSDEIYFPKTPNSEDMENEMVLRGLLYGWKDPGKIVICLTNKYTKENLSLENLKSTDLAIAMLLKKTNGFLNNFSNFDAFLGFLNRTYHGEVTDIDIKFNTKCPSNILRTDYAIECLRHIDGNGMMDFKEFNVNFNDEVWPVDCFAGVKPYRCSREYFRDVDPVLERNTSGYHVAKYYRVPVLVLFKTYSFIEELKNSLVTVADIYKMFITLYDEYDRKREKEYAIPIMERQRFDNWAWIISRMSLPECRQNRYHSKELTVRFLKVLISLGDLRPIQNYFKCNRVLTEEIVPLLISQCNKFGWLKFSDELCGMFKETNSFVRAQKFFQLFIDSKEPTTVPNKRTVLQSVFNVILDNEKGRHHHDFKEFMCSVWNLANRFELDMREYGKSLNIDDIVPFLIELFEDDREIRSNDNWLDIANHFIRILDQNSNKPTLTWSRLSVNVSGNCECIQKLLKFLKDDVQSTTFTLHDSHRNHLKSVISRLAYLTYMTSDEIGTADIFILKTKKTGENTMYMYQRNIPMLSKLRSICEC